MKCHITSIQLHPNKKGSMIIQWDTKNSVIRCPANDIKNINTLLTVLGGEEVYKMNTSNTTVMWEGLPVSCEAQPV